MERRAFLGTMMTGGLLAAPLSAQAQQPGKVYRIGVLETAPMVLTAVNLDAFRQGLRELGYVEGQNLVIEYRSADGRADRFPDLANELVRLKVDLILTRGTPAITAAKNATRTIPIVMTASGDPVGRGVVRGLAHPGANVTGLTSLGPEVSAKRLQLLKETIPRIQRIAALFEMGNVVWATQWPAVQQAAQSMGLRAQLLDVRKAEDLQPAFEAAIKQRAEALLVGFGTVMQSNVGRVVDLAAKRRLPAIYSSREFVDAGGLMAYGVHYPDLYRRAATYVDKIFKGARPGDLPIEQATKFEFVVNLKTAKALGLAIPPSLLGRADEVIQ
jgi:putative ABC transport system substrate-binding protein